MQDKDTFTKSLLNECLKLIANKKANMPSLAYKMGMSIMDLYKLLLEPNDDISYYLNIIYLLN